MLAFSPSAFCLEKKLTVMGIIGKTQGVSSENSPATNANNIKAGIPESFASCSFWLVSSFAAAPDEAGGAGADTLGTYFVNSDLAGPEPTVNSALTVIGLGGKHT